MIYQCPCGRTGENSQEVCEHLASMSVIIITQRHGRRIERECGALDELYTGFCGSSCYNCLNCLVAVFIVHPEKKERFFCPCM
jgi:hypothetical protein